MNYSDHIQDQSFSKMFFDLATAGVEAKYSRFEQTRQKLRTLIVQVIRMDKGPDGNATDFNEAVRKYVEVVAREKPGVLDVEQEIRFFGRLLAMTVHRAKFLEIIKSLALNKEQSATYREVYRAVRDAVEMSRDFDLPTVLRPVQEVRRLESYARDRMRGEIERLFQQTSPHKPQAAPKPRVASAPRRAPKPRYAGWSRNGW